MSPLDHLTAQHLQKLKKGIDLFSAAGGSKVSIRVMSYGFFEYGAARGGLLSTFVVVGVLVIPRIPRIRMMPVRIRMRFYLSAGFLGRFLIFSSLRLRAKH